MISRAHYLSDSNRRIGRQHSAFTESLRIDDARKKKPSSGGSSAQGCDQAYFPSGFFHPTGHFYPFIGSGRSEHYENIIESIEGIEMPVTNLTKKTWLATKVRKADSFLTRLVGLLKRNHLGPEEALWLMPSKGIHTIGMKFPIDVVFLDKDNTVLGIISGLVPYRVTGVRLKGHSVLELPKGTLKKSRTEVGDQLEISLVESSVMDDLRETRLSQIA